MNVARSETATAADCDWSFVSNEPLMAALESLARRKAGYGQDPEDVLQELILWLAPRLELHDLDIPFTVRQVNERVRQLNEKAKGIFETEIDYGTRLDG